MNDVGQIRTLCSALTKPVNTTVEAIGATASFDQLAEVGVKRISLGYGSLVKAGREMKQYGTFGFLDDVPDFAEIGALFR